MPTHAASIILLGLFAGFGGSLIDSLTGRFLQFSGYDIDRDKNVSRPGPNVTRICGRPLLSNSQNNLLSASITSVLTALLAVKYFCKPAFA